LHFNFRLLGGKGGFGALLRGQGGGHKTTNFDDCRDLNGRRLRHLKNEMKLSDWYAEQKALEIEREAQKSAKSEPRKHQFDASELIEANKKIKASIAASVESGLRLKRQKTETSVSLKSDLMWEGLGAITGVDDFAVDCFPDPTGSTPDSAPDSTGLSGASCSAAKLAPPASSSCCLPDSDRSLSKANDQQEDADSSDSESDDSDDDDAMVTLDMFSSAAELESLGLEELKEQLQLRGLKCGGALKERAERLFSVKGKTPDQYDPKIRAVAKKN